MSEPGPGTSEVGETGLEAQAEATGETVGEAKWAALRELERRFPGLDKSTVELVVLSEGERGLLGVGFVPARVIARIAEPPPRPPSPEEPELASPVAARLKELLERVRDALDVDATVAVREQGESLVATFHGRDLGLLIGKHGQTIDAIQYLATAALSRGAERRADVVVDAAGYRDRRRATLESLADRAAARVASSGSAAALDPMSSAERKIVHLHLQERPDVVTASEGAEPNRHVVIRPAE